jgi:general secretion pathway protein A
MSYYNILGLYKEPFSTSPDPDFLYKSRSHVSALHRLEIAIRLKRGLTLLLGDIGTGKTTLARALIQSFKNEPEYVFHIILDPHQENRSQFISNLSRIFGLECSYSDEPDVLEKYLFQKGVIENKTVVLIIDEGQKLNYSCIEVLRTLLNYETNEFKLLQLVIMAQLEFLETAGKVRNFMDRIAFKYLLNPLDEGEMRDMIKYRLQQAGMIEGKTLFSEEALHEIYNYTKGYPRKITNLCHQSLENIVMCNRRVIDVDLVRDLIKQEVGIMQSNHLLYDAPPFREITA